MSQKIAAFWGKNTYQNPLACYKELERKVKTQPPSTYEVLAYRLLLKYLEAQGLPEHYRVQLGKRLKNKKSNPDMFVPSDEQVFDTLSKLKLHNRILYLVYLCSGLRKTEGAYLYENLDRLKVQEMNGFVKINLSTFRRTKTAYFCYLPAWLFALFKEHREQLTVRGLDNYITVHKLIGPKYARKWFFTKCIELGIPESIADFYEGRVSTTIGANHYLAKQSLADKCYHDLLIGRFALLQPCVRQASVEQNMRYH